MLEEKDNGHGNDCPAAPDAADHASPAVGTLAPGAQGQERASDVSTGVDQPDAAQRAGHTLVNVCHATSSDSNSYVFITVDDDSTKVGGHLAHCNEPNKTWKSDGTFRGAPVKAGDPKRDLIGDYTDSAGVRHVYDGVITSEADCGSLTPPPPPVVKAGGSFATVCTPTAAAANMGTLTTGLATPGTFRLVASGFSVAVVSNQANVPVPADTVLTLEYAPQSGGVQVIPPSQKSPRACPAVTPTGGDRRLEVRKAASAAVVQFGDPLTYTLTVRALGTLGQTTVVVRDDIPAGTTYVSGSAACDASGPCMESFASNEVTWALGAMAPGATRTVSFQVTINTPRATPESGIPGVTIRNTGLAFSAELRPTPSNEVVTDVVPVGGVKIGPNSPAGGSGGVPNPEDDVAVSPTSVGLLAYTGTGPPLAAIALFGGLLLLAGAAMLRAGRQKWPRTQHLATHRPGFLSRSATNVYRRSSGT